VCRETTLPFAGRRALNLDFLGQPAKILFQWPVRASHSGGIGLNLNLKIGVGAVQAGSTQAFTASPARWPSALNPSCVSEGGSNATMRHSVCHHLSCFQIAESVTGFAGFDLIAIPPIGRVGSHVWTLMCALAAQIYFSKVGLEILEYPIASSEEKTKSSFLIL
jgi:hypothetical protein